MRYCRLTNGNLPVSEMLRTGRDVATEDGVTRPWQWVVNAPIDELALYNIFQWDEVPPPEGSRSTGYAETIIDGVVVRVNTHEPIVSTVLEIKGEARRRILARYPDWKQTNMNARGNELNDIRFERPLTQAEADERLALKAAKAWIDSVRAASDQLEGEIAAGTYAGLAENWAGWPA